MKQLAAIYQDLKKPALKTKRDLQTNSLFEARPFAELVVAARLIAKERIASLKER